MACPCFYRVKPEALKTQKVLLSKTRHGSAEALKSVSACFENLFTKGVTVGV